MAYVPSQDSDQPGWASSLIRVFAVRMKKAGSLATHWAHSEDSDQTGRMPRLIWVYAGRKVILLVLSWGGSFKHWVEWYSVWKGCLSERWTANAQISLCLTAVSMEPYCHKNMELEKTSKKIYSLAIMNGCMWAGPWENVSYIICKQQRRRSACASAQSDQHLCCSLLK